MKDNKTPRDSILALEAIKRCKYLSTQYTLLLWR